MQHWNHQVTFLATVHIFSHSGLSDCKTHSMEQSPSWEANSHLSNQEIPQSLNVHCALPYSQEPATVTYLSQMNPVHNFLSYIPKIHSDITLPSMPGFSNQNFVCVSHLSHACNMPHPSHLPWLDYLNNIWWSIHIMKLLIMQSSPSSCHFLPLGSKYSQCPIFRHPQSECFNHFPADESDECILHTCHVCFPATGCFADCKTGYWKLEGVSPAIHAGAAAAGKNEFWLVWGS